MPVKTSYERTSHERRAREKVQAIVGSADSRLAIATLEGEINCATHEEWLEAMRARQFILRHVTEWVKAVSELGGACGAWLSLHRTWAHEIAVRFNAEPASVSLYVVVKDASGITLEQRRQVADMGLVLGGSFGVRAEARIVSTRPGHRTFIIA